jgi:radical SAM/Cys-rich protein
MPISRFLEYLLESGNYESYMERLVEAFNPATISGLMCRNTLSVSWDGYIFDCDFNQMLDLKVNSSSRHIKDFDLSALNNRSIVLDQHCYGCTAGTGSSCGGSIA